MGSDVPYGMWICKDGSVYLFNRGYQPIAVRKPGQPAELVKDPNMRVDFCSQVWFYKSANTVDVDDLKAILDNFLKDAKSRYAL